MTSRQRELYVKLRRRAGKLRTRLVRRRQPEQHASTVAGPRRRRRPPDVVLESTNLGPVMDEAVFRAKRRMRIGADPDYNLLYENFDVLHYLLQAPHLLDQPDVDLIEHFLKRGVAERLSPNPDFSMAEYVSRYPGKVADQRVRNPYLYWLKRGRAEGDVADPAPRINRMAYVLGRESEEVVDLVAERRRDLQRRFRTGRLGEMFARATEIEPLIGAVWTEVANPKLLPLSRRPVADEVLALYHAHEAADFKRARVVLVVSRAEWGGGRQMQDHLAHALGTQVDHDEIVVVYTDESIEAPVGRFPNGVRQIDLANLVRGLSPEQAQHALVMLLRTFQADAVVNVNSRLLYQAMRAYGRAMAATERLFLCFSGNEQTPMGTWEGRSLGYFYRTFDYVAGVITDSHYLIRELTKTYRIGKKDVERMHVLRPPVDPSLPTVSESPAMPERRPQVFWAGRWDRRKRIDIVVEVARRIPEVDFRIWGKPALTRSYVNDAPRNVSFEGPCEYVSELNLSDADLWLYTSDWAGVPSRLLEFAMTGVPIVGSLVGDTGDVLNDGDSWPVADRDNPYAYVQAIRDVLADPVGSRRRAMALRDRMLQERSEKAFAIQVGNLLLTEDESWERG